MSLPRRSVHSNPNMINIQQQPQPVTTVSSSSSSSADSSDVGGRLIGDLNAELGITFDDTTKQTQELTSLYHGGLGGGGGQRGSVLIGGGSPGKGRGGGFQQGEAFRAPNNSNTQRSSYNNPSMNSNPSLVPTSHSNSGANLIGPGQGPVVDQQVGSMMKMLSVKAKSPSSINGNISPANSGGPSQNNSPIQQAAKPQQGSVTHHPLSKQERDRMIHNNLATNINKDGGNIAVDIANNTLAYEVFGGADLNLRKNQEKSSRMNERYNQQQNQNYQNQNQNNLLGGEKAIDGHLFFGGSGEVPITPSSTSRPVALPNFAGLMGKSQSINSRRGDGFTDNLNQVQMGKKDSISGFTGSSGLAQSASKVRMMEKQQSIQNMKNQKQQNSDQTQKQTKFRTSSSATYGNQQGVGNSSGEFPNTTTSDDVTSQTQTQSQLTSNNNSGPNTGIDSLNDDDDDISFRGFTKKVAVKRTMSLADRARKLEASFAKKEDQERMEKERGQAQAQQQATVESASINITDTSQGISAVTGGDSSIQKQATSSQSTSQQKLNVPGAQPQQDISAAAAIRKGQSKFANFRSNQKNLGGGGVSLGYEYFQTRGSTSMMTQTDLARKLGLHDRVGKTSKSGLDVEGSENLQFTASGQVIELDTNANQKQMTVNFERKSQYQYQSQGLGSSKDRASGPESSSNTLQPMVIQQGEVMIPETEKNVNLKGYAGADKLRVSRSVQDKNKSQGIMDRLMLPRGGDSSATSSARGSSKSGVNIGKDETQQNQNQNQQQMPFQDQYQFQFNDIGGSSGTMNINNNYDNDGDMQTNQDDSEPTYDEIIREMGGEEKDLVKNRKQALSYFHRYNGGTSTGTVYEFVRPVSEKESSRKKNAINYLKKEEEILLARTMNLDLADLCVCEDKNSRKAMQTAMFFRGLSILSHKEYEKQRARYSVEPFGQDRSNRSQKRWRKLISLARCRIGIGPKDFGGFTVSDRVLAERVLPKVSEKLHMKESLKRLDMTKKEGYKWNNRGERIKDIFFRFRQKPKAVRSEEQQKKAFQNMYLGRGCEDEREEKINGRLGNYNNSSGQNIAQQTLNQQQGLVLEQRDSNVTEQGMIRPSIDRSSTIAVRGTAYLGSDRSSTFNTNSNSRLTINQVISFNSQLNLNQNQLNSMNQQCQSQQQTNHDNINVPVGRWPGHQLSTLSMDNRAHNISTGTSHAAASGHISAQPWQLKDFQIDPYDVAFKDLEQNPNLLVSLEHNIEAPPAIIPQNQNQNTLILSQSQLQSSSWQCLPEDSALTVGGPGPGGLTTSRISGLLSASDNQSKVGSANDLNLSQNYVSNQNQKGNTNYQNSKVYQDWIDPANRVLDQQYYGGGTTMGILSPQFGYNSNSGSQQQAQTDRTLTKTVQQKKENPFSPDNKNKRSEFFEGGGSKSPKLDPGIYDSSGNKKQPWIRDPKVACDIFSHENTPEVSPNKLYKGPGSMGGSPGSKGVGVNSPVKSNVAQQLQPPPGPGLPSQQLQYQQQQYQQNNLLSDSGPGSILNKFASGGGELRDVTGLIQSGASVVSPTVGSPGRVSQRNSTNNLTINTNLNQSPLNKGNIPDIKNMQSFTGSGTSQGQQQATNQQESIQQQFSSASPYKTPNDMKHTMNEVKKMAATLRALDVAGSLLYGNQDSGTIEEDNNQTVTSQQVTQTTVQSSPRTSTVNNNQKIPLSNMGTPRPGEGQQGQESGTQTNTVNSTLPTDSEVTQTQQSQSPQNSPQQSSAAAEALPSQTGPVSRATIHVSSPTTTTSKPFDLNLLLANDVKSQHYKDHPMGMLEKAKQIIKNNQHVEAIAVLTQGSGGSVGDETPGTNNMIQRQHSMIATANTNMTSDSGQYSPNSQQGSQSGTSPLKRVMTGGGSSSNLAANGLNASNQNSPSAGESNATNNTTKNQSNSPTKTTSASSSAAGGGSGGQGHKKSSVNFAEGVNNNGKVQECQCVREIAGRKSLAASSPSLGKK